VVSKLLIYVTFFIYYRIYKNQKWKNPIKENRIINDKTFARRLKSHLQETKASCAMGEEEIEYLKTVAEKLLRYQIETSPKDEQQYHSDCDEKTKS